MHIFFAKSDKVNKYRVTVFYLSGIYVIFIRHDFDLYRFVCGW